MAAIRCAGAGRALLRRGSLLRRAAADVGERGVHPIAPLSSLSSNRYMSSYTTEEEDRKKLAAALMKERTPSREIQNLDEMLRLTNSHADRLRWHYYPSMLDDLEAKSDSCRQQEASRSAVEAKKVDLVSTLLRPDAGDKEYKQKMDEFAVAVRHHRQSLLLEDLKYKKELHSKLIAGIMLWGVWLTCGVLSKLS